MLDHFVYGASDLDEAVALLADLVGVFPSGGGRHDGLGTHNALLGLGSNKYLEIIAPDPSQSNIVSSRPLGLSDLTNPKLIAWAATASDLEGRISEGRKAGFDAGVVTNMTRIKPNGDVLEWELTHRSQGPGEDGVVPFLIDWGESEHPSKSCAVGCTLNQWYVEHPDPPKIRRFFASLGVQSDVKLAEIPALVAIIDTPNGIVELR